MFILHFFSNLANIYRENVIFIEKMLSTYMIELIYSIINKRNFQHLINLAF